MKHLPVIALLLFAVLGCANTAPKPAKVAAGPPVAVAAADLTRAYKENELAADERFKNRALEVSGKITGIAEVLGSIQVDLEGHKESGINFMTVKCTMPESEKAAVARLKTGQQAVFQGTGEGLTLNLYVGLTDCKIRN